jgi:hypothetical protein
MTKKNKNYRNGKINVPVAGVLCTAAAMLDRCSVRPMARNRVSFGFGLEVLL